MGSEGVTQRSLLGRHAGHLRDLAVGLLVETSDTCTEGLKSLPQARHPPDQFFALCIDRFLQTALLRSDRIHGSGRLLLGLGKSANLRPGALLQAVEVMLELFRCGNPLCHTGFKRLCVGPQDLAK